MILTKNFGISFDKSSNELCIRVMDQTGTLEHLYYGSAIPHYNDFSF